MTAEMRFQFTNAHSIQARLQISDYKCNMMWSQHVMFWNARDLERKLADFQAYYKRGTQPCVVEAPHALDLYVRAHSRLAELNNVRWVCYCRDLIQLPAAA